MSEYPDLDRFIHTLRATHRELFDSDEPLTVARAPGRLDVMGGIADYSGSLVLEAPLREATFCAVQPRSDRTIRILSMNARDAEMEPLFIANLDYLQPQYGDPSYELTRERMRRDPRRRWAAYVAGVFTVLEAEGYLRFDRGANIAISSDVPLGAGVSSSAALEVATMMAITAAYGVDVEPLKVARMCQTVENLIVGAPCGIMDQVTSLLGKSGSLTAIVCQPHELQPSLVLPDGVRCVGFDTHVKHSVAGSRYIDTRVGAFMGQRIIEHTLTANGRKPDPTAGYLANVTPSEYTERWRDILPSEMRGADFLARYRRTNDRVTTVRHDTVYRVRSRAEHPIYENDRVYRFREHLARASEVNGAKRVRELTAAGKLMYGSHWSYGSRCAMGSPETDLVVRLVKDLGPKAGFFGAKITGGGSGGTVAILCRAGTDDALRALAEKYADETKRSPRLFFESGPGALAWGVRTVRL